MCRRTVHQGHIFAPQVQGKMGIGVRMMVAGGHTVPVATVDQTIKNRGRPWKNSGKNSGKHQSLDLKILEDTWRYLKILEDTWRLEKPKSHTCLHDKSDDSMLTTLHKPWLPSWLHNNRVNPNGSKWVKPLLNQISSQGGFCYVIQDPGIKLTNFSRSTWDPGKSGTYWGDDRDWYFKRSWMVFDVEWLMDIGWCLMHAFDGLCGMGDIRWMMMVMDD